MNQLKYIFSFFNDDNFLHPFLTPIKLKGNTILKDRIFPAPMEGILEPAFCKVLRKRKLVHSWITPFFRVTTGVPNLSTMKRFLKAFECDKVPVIVQLMGNNIELLAKTSLFIKENFPIVGINLNFACPSKVVCSKNAGGALLKSPTFISDILSSIEEVCPDISLSIKIRMGFEMPDEIIHISKALENNKLDFVFLHHRTIVENYKKVPGRLERFKMARQAFHSTPIFLSGDIFSIDDATELGNANVGDGMVIARGLIKTPWLIDDIREYFNHGAIKENQDNRPLEFFCDMLELAVENNVNWNKNYYAEIARYLFGVKSEGFETYKKNHNNSPEEIYSCFRSKLNN